MTRTCVVVLALLTACPAPTPVDTDTDVPTDTDPHAVTGLNICTLEFGTPAPDRNVFVAESETAFPDLAVTGADGCVIVERTPGTWYVQPEELDATCPTMFMPYEVIGGETTDVTIDLGDFCFG